MKEKILELRKNGLSYDEIQKKLGCAKSTISYHCKNNNVNIPVIRKNKISDDIINNMINDRKTNSVKDISIKYNVCVNTVVKYCKMDVKKDRLCIHCNINTLKSHQKYFCCNKCNSEYKHFEAYKKFLKNNNEYCTGKYTAKNFKDFFLKEQNNKCAICNSDPIWNDKELIFVLDHIDGDASNNKRKNLRLICPNCDSQTDTFKSKNKNSKRRNYYREKIINNLNGSNPAG